jgi:hypothetical protein
VGKSSSRRCATSSDETLQISPQLTSLRCQVAQLRTNFFLGRKKLHNKTYENKSVSGETAVWRSEVALFDPKQIRDGFKEELSTHQ